MYDEAIYNAAEFVRRMEAKGLFEAGSTDRVMEFMRLCAEAGLPLPVGSWHAGGGPSCRFTADLYVTMALEGCTVMTPDAFQGCYDVPSLVSLEDAASICAACLEPRSQPLL